MLPIQTENIYLNHTHIINKLIERFKFKTYLEIGVDNPNLNYNSINIESKESCDIEDRYNIGLTYCMSSDEMFLNMPADKKYDIIFIDGMHDSDFVDRDITNSLKHMNEGGIICIHDAIPFSEESQRKLKLDDSINILKDNKVWNGDVWKSIVKFNSIGIEFYTVDNGDYGLSIIRYKNGDENKDLTQHKVNIEYKDIFNNVNSIFGTLNLQGRYTMHVIDLYDLKKIFKLIF